MTNLNERYARTRRDSPSGGQVVVVGTAFAQPCRALWVTTAGTIEVEFPGGATLSYSNVPVGRFVIAATKVVSVTGAVVQNAEW
jgi:hypothetical protein